jgi:hypothetical protein
LGLVLPSAVVSGLRLERVSGLEKARVLEKGMGLGWPWALVSGLVRGLVVVWGLVLGWGLRGVLRCR